MTNNNNVIIAVCAIYRDVKLRRGGIKNPQRFFLIFHDDDVQLILYQLKSQK